MDISRSSVTRTIQLTVVTLHFQAYRHVRVTIPRSVETAGIPKVLKQRLMGLMYLGEEWYLHRQWASHWGTELRRDVNHVKLFVTVKESSTMADGADSGLYRRLADAEEGFNERLRKTVAGRREDVSCYPHSSRCWSTGCIAIACWTRVRTLTYASCRLIIRSA